MLKATLIKKLGLYMFLVKFSDSSGEYMVELRGNKFYLLGNNNPVIEEDQKALFKMLRGKIINYTGDL